MSKLKETIESSLDIDETKALTVRVMKTDRSNTYYYDRDPKFHRYIQTILRPQFDELGIENYTDDYGNFVASMGKKKGKRVMIVQHSQEWGPSDEEPQTLSQIHEPGDVVDASKLGIKGFEPRQYGVEGEVVWGRGGCEAAGGAIATTEAARMLARSGVNIQGEVLFVVTAGGHSAASDNIFHLIHNDEVRVDMAMHQGLHDEGIHGSRICTGGRGRVDIRLAVLGKITHSSQDEGGSNALAGALVALERLKKIMPTPNGKVDPESGHKPRLTPIVMETYPKPPGHLWGTGSAGHTLQNLARVTLDRRILKQETVDQAVNEIREAIGDLSPWKYRVERGAYHFPWSVPRDAPVVKFASKAVSEMLGVEPKLEYMTAAWDMGAVNRLGIPCVTYGTAGPMVIDPPIGPHCENDFATLNWIYDAAQVYAHFAATATE